MLPCSICNCDTTVPAREQFCTLHHVISLVASQVAGSGTLKGVALRHAVRMHQSIIIYLMKRAQQLRAAVLLLAPYHTPDCVCM